MRDLAAGNPIGSVWYLAQCKPGQEHIAAGQIALRGLAAVFLPREARRRRWRGRWQNLLAPVFPGYLFLAPDAAQPDWPALRCIRGLTRIVGFGAQGPARVPAGMVAALRARCDAEGVMQRADDLQPGERVRVLDGPFAELVGRIETLAAGDRIDLLLELMGREVRVLARKADLDRAGPA